MYGITLTHKKLDPTKARYPYFRYHEDELVYLKQFLKVMRGDKIARTALTALLECLTKHRFVSKPRPKWKFTIDDKVAAMWSDEELQWMWRVVKILRSKNERMKFALKRIVYVMENLSLR